jgi:hypothetical protein
MICGQEMLRNSAKEVVHVRDQAGKRLMRPLSRRFFFGLAVAAPVAAVAASDAKSRGWRATGSGDFLEVDIAGPFADAGPSLDPTSPWVQSLRRLLDRRYLVDGEIEQAEGLAPRRFRFDGAAGFPPELSEPEVLARMEQYERRCRELAEEITRLNRAASGSEAESPPAADLGCAETGQTAAVDPGSAEDGRRLG